MGRSIASSGDRRFPKGERKALWYACRRILPAPAGPDAPTPAREKGLQPYGALTLFFRWRKKSVQKKASGTATLAARPAARRGLRSAVAPSGLSSTSVRFAHPSGKKPFIAHFDGGARYVARSGVGQLTPAIVRARSSPFSAVKMGGPFSLRCLSPLCSPAVGGGQAYPLQGFCFRRSGCGAVLPLAREKGFCGLAALPLKRKRLLLRFSWRGAGLPRAGILLPSQWVWCSLVPCGGMGF